MDYILRFEKKSTFHRECHKGKCLSLIYKQLKGVKLIILRYSTVTNRWQTLVEILAERQQRKSNTQTHTHNKNSDIRKKNRMHKKRQI